MSAEQWVIVVGAFLMGACIGSFVNVVAFRMPRGLSFVTPRSACPHCGELIAAYDNIPLLSFIRLLGQCRWCGQPIPWRYIGVEVLMGAATAVAAWAYLLPPTLEGMTAAVVVTAFVGGLVVVALVDLERRIIPDQISKPGILAGFIGSALHPGLHPVMPGVSAMPMLNAMADSAMGCCAAAFGLWAVSRLGAKVFKQEALGLGDVKLVAAMGAFLGLAGVGLAAMAAVLSGVVVGLVVLVVWRSRWLAFGPFLSLGGALVALWPHQSLRLYLVWSNWLGGLLLGSV